VPASQHQPQPDLEFERLQQLIRKLAEETTGPRANMEVAGAMAAVGLAANSTHVSPTLSARLPRTFDRADLSAAAQERSAQERVAERAPATPIEAVSTAALQAAHYVAPHVGIVTPQPRIADRTGADQAGADRTGPSLAMATASTSAAAKPPAYAVSVAAETPGAPINAYGRDHWRNELSVAMPNYGAVNHFAALQDSGLAAQMSEAIAAERVDVLLTPVQGLADRKAHHYEISVRLKLSDGIALDHGALSSAARTAGLGGRLDALRLSRVARVARHVERRSQSQRVLSSFIGSSLAEDAFLEAVAEQLGANPAARIVMGFSQDDVRSFGPAHWDTIETMSDMGLGFALEDVTDLDMDFAQLRKQGFTFVKLDASVFLEGLPASDGPVPSADICRHLAEHQLALIVGEIDDEWALAKIMGLGVVLGQGVMFGGARPVKPEILETTH
jgi:EAL domain-containing protein (putative c-di-GMP-specific phosphodiesterase class I)